MSERANERMNERADEQMAQYSARLFLKHSTHCVVVARKNPKKYTSFLDVPIINIMRRQMERRTVRQRPTEGEGGRKNDG